MKFTALTADTAPTGDDLIATVNDPAGTPASRKVTLHAAIAGATLDRTSKATPVDADLIPLVDSAASNVLKKLTWANVKATLLSYLATSGVLALTRPKITTSIDDANGNEVIKTPATASAVNEITVTNAATGGRPTVAATGGDTNIDIVFASKGSGKIYFDDGSGNRYAEVDLSSGGRFRFNNSGGGYLTSDSRNFFSHDGLLLKQTGLVNFGSSGDFYNGTDTGIARNGAGIVEANNGVAGTLRDFKARTYYYSATVFDTSGTGSPEGVLTAGIGSTYRRTDGGAATSFYVKESGTGNTGWAAK